MRRVLTIAATISIGGCSHPIGNYASTPPLPTRQDAANAYFAYEEDVCSALIDVCEGIVETPPEAIDRLACQRESRGTAVCGFEYPVSHCQARFVVADSPFNGWTVAFRTRGR